MIDVELSLSQCLHVKEILVLEEELGGYEIGLLFEHFEDRIPRLFLQPTKKNEILS